MKVFEALSKTERDFYSALENKMEVEFMRNMQVYSDHQKAIAEEMVTVEAAFDIIKTTMTKLNAYSAPRYPEYHPTQGEPKLLMTGFMFF